MQDATRSPVKSCARRSGPPFMYEKGLVGLEGFSPCGILHEAEQTTRALDQMAGMGGARQLCHILAALSGASAVGMGAYGAHAFKPSDAAFVEVWCPAAKDQQSTCY